MQKNMHNERYEKKTENIKAEWRKLCNEDISEICGYTESMISKYQINGRYSNFSNDNRILKMDDVTLIRKNNIDRLNRIVLREIRETNFKEY